MYEPVATGNLRGSYVGRYTAPGSGGEHRKVPCPRCGHPVERTWKKTPRFCKDCRSVDRDLVERWSR